MQKKNTANRETLSHRASEQAEIASKVDFGQSDITNDSAVDGNSSASSCREHPVPRNSQNSRLRAILIDHVKIGLVTEIEVFKSAGALVKEVQVPSRQRGNVKSWVRVSRGLEQYARHFTS